MRSLVLLLLASCYLAAAARRKERKSLPKKYAGFQDVQTGASKADPVLHEQSGVEASQGGCGGSYGCVYVRNYCTVTLNVTATYLYGSIYSFFGRYSYQVSKGSDLVGSSRGMGSAWD